MVQALVIPVVLSIGTFAFNGNLTTRNAFAHNILGEPLKSTFSL